MPQVGWVQAFSLKVFSEKERDIKTTYEAMLGGLAEFCRAMRTYGYQGINLFRHETMAASVWDAFTACTP